MYVIDEDDRNYQNDRRRVSVIIPLLFIVVLWFIQFLQWGLGLDLAVLGVLPRQVVGLDGIVFSPLIHGSWSHLASNTLPLLVLGFLLIYFYRHVAYRVVLWVWLIDGCGVWLIGRDSYHIGASGLVYGMASFLFFSGLFRRNRQLQALSLAVVFIYGGIVWGMFPNVTSVSWEAHLMGFLAGVFLAFFYRHRGPADDQLPEWMDEPDDGSLDEPYENEEQEQSPLSKRNEPFSGYVSDITESGSWRDEEAD